jgi:iron complex outermembrane recepter protein
MKKSNKLLAGLLFSAGSVMAQQQDSVDIYTLSLEELMNIEIVSASKKSENLFEAPLSASVITKDEIRNAGSTSIMEALRLIPGVIVREQSNGNYDIHVRGLDNVPPNSLILSSTNTTTLVMIDNRPVYNYLQGGTFWESLPIDLNDVERIEVVRGPSSTLYGPNAVSGVINIITGKISKSGVSAQANLQQGTSNTSVANASVGYKFNERFDVGVSGNFQSRGRDIRYMDYINNRWVNSPLDLPVPNAKERYPHPDKSMIKYGVNSFIHFKPKEKIDLNLSIGAQDSEVQNITFDNGISNFSTITTNSRYADLRAETYGFTTQLSYTSANQYPVKGMEGSQYDYHVFDGNLEYEFNVNKLSVKPGVTYRSAVYNDSKYSDASSGAGVLDGKKTMDTYGATIRFEYKMLNDNLRLTGGVRADRFTYPKNWFVSYQAAASYKLNEKNILRLVYSKSFRSPFIFDTYINYTSTTPLGPDMPGMFSQYTTTGSKDLDMLNSTMLELGYRASILKNISLDFELYSTRTENYTALIQDATTMTPENYPIVASTNLFMMNLPFHVQQTGASVSLNIVLDKIQIKPFVTVQKTTLKDYSPYFGTTNAAPGANNKFDPASNNLNSGKGSETEHRFTPKAYGGAHVNYSISSKFNFNMNAYWFAQHTFYHSENISYAGTRGVENVEGKLLLNAKIAYTPVKAVSVFVTGKNLLNKKSVEYYDGDATPAMILGGVNVKF